MKSIRIRSLGYVLAVIGVVFLAVAGVAYAKTHQGYQSLAAFSAEQNVTLSYDENGNLTDHGTVEGAEAIKKLLTEDWGYAINASDLDPNDPVVNTATEYMYQMATIYEHTLTGSVQVTLTEPVEYNGVRYDAGTYDVPTEGKYYSEFDRSDPLQGPARSLVWSPTVFGLTAQLGVGTVTAYTLQLALGLTALFAALGLTILLTGLGLVWASQPDPQVPAMESVSEKAAATV
jgi:hypothetical protein